MYRALILYTPSELGDGARLLLYGSGCGFLEPARGSKEGHLSEVFCLL